MSYSLWNLCDRSDSVALLDALERSGFALRRVDTSGVSSSAALLDRFGEQLDFSAGGWDSFADHMWTALLPDDDEGDRVALVWDHADDVAAEALDAFLQAMDVLIGVGRGAYAEDLQVITFLLGDGSSFAPVDVAAMFPGLA